MTDSTPTAFPFAALLPLRALAVTLELTAEARFSFFHQAAVHALVRHLAGSPEPFHTLLASDAPESGRTDYRAGDGYRFAVYGLPGSEAALARLLTGLRGLPGSAPRTAPQVPLRDNLRLSALQDLFSGDPVASVADLTLYDLERLLAETALWTHAPAIRLRWLSPVRLDQRQATGQGAAATESLKGEARFCHCAADLADGLLPRRLYDAAASLLRERGGSAPPRSVPSVLPAPAGHLFWVDSEYRDAAGQSSPVGGLTGELDLGPATAIPPDWLRLLVLGQYLGLGERRALGLGRYRLETPDGWSTAPGVEPAASLLAAAARDDNLYAAYRVIRDNQVRKANAGGHADAGAGEPQGAPDDAYATWDTEYPDLPDPDEEEQLADRLERLGNRLREADYQPPALAGVVFRERDGDLRGLAIPPFWDRVVQRALVQRIAPALESVFSAASHAYRPGHSRHTAGSAIQRAWRDGYRWVYEADIQGFFDNLDWQRLGERLRALYRDDPAVDLLLAWMAAPVDYQGMRIERSRGLPQGAPLSPMLANLMLDDMDSDLEHAGFRLVRYADDFVVLCKDRERAEAAGAAVRRSLAELGLTLNEDKSRSVGFDQGFRYLGFLFLNDLVIDTAGQGHASTPSGAPKPPAAGSWLARLTRSPPVPLGPTGPEPPPAPPAAPQVSGGPATPVRDPAAPAGLGQLTDAGQLLLITGAPVLIATRQGRLVATRDDQTVTESPWRQLQAVVCFGQHHVTTPALRAAFAHQVPIHFASGGGTYQGSAWSGRPGAEGAGFWLTQQARCADPQWALAAARAVIVARIRHQRELLRQRQPSGFETARQALHQAALDAAQAPDPSTLNGIEGAAARAYFQALAATIPAAYGFDGRNRRPPRDPFNALLSLGYTLLYAHVDTLLRVAGLYPWIGFYHQPHGRHAALASDLMEPFRHVIERAALRAVTRQGLKPEEFHLDPTLGCRLSPAALRRYLALIWERLEAPAESLAEGESRSILQQIHGQNRRLIEAMRGGTPFTAWVAR
ncbi:CRISPR-associated endonuclease Cas1 [uncultured Thiodictyon sp.]|uniref:CRISPR-associated endonuclease Cas1 n=1 Tax=uncultured Thiodictyon sp. TaxID=1846217 RepID=UPI0025E3D809|nr:CRISPR-associated endonuclease Cas1 [uncultured Thiodictyon sp.]